MLLLFQGRNIANNPLDRYGEQLYQRESKSKWIVDPSIQLELDAGGSHDQKIIKSLEELSKSGNFVAAGYLGRLKVKGVIVPKNVEEGVALLRLSAKAGCVPAMAYLGFIYSEGVGVKVDHSEAVRWSLQAAEAGDATA
jgi:TPR repeat protein